MDLRSMMTSQSKIHVERERMFEIISEEMTRRLRWYIAPIFKHYGEIESVSSIGIIFEQ